MLFILWSRV